MAMGVREEEILRSALKGSRRDLSRLLSLIESGQEINVYTQDSWTLGVTAVSYTHLTLPPIYSV